MLGKRKTMAQREGLLSGKKRMVIRTVARRNRAPRIKGAIKPSGRTELKFVDIASANYVADTTGTVTALNLVAVGDDNTTRDGRQVTVKSVQVRGFLAPVDAMTGFSKARLLLVWDNAVNSGTIATVADILTAANSVSFPLVNNANRFTILSDQSYALGANDTATATATYAASPTTYNVEYYRKLDSVTQYSGTTAAIGSIQNGGLLMVTIGSSAAGTGGVFVLATRVRFVDD